MPGIGDFDTWGGVHSMGAAPRPLSARPWTSVPDRHLRVPVESAQQPAGSRHVLCESETQRGKDDGSEPRGVRRENGDGDPGSTVPAGVMKEGR